MNQSAKISRAINRSFNKIKRTRRIHFVKPINRDDELIVETKVDGEWKPLTEFTAPVGGVYDISMTTPVETTGTRVRLI